MDLIGLTDKNGKYTNNAEYADIRDAYLEVFRTKSYSRQNFISINHVAEELEMEIYLQSVVLIDHTKFYDGPSGSAELAVIRFKEGEILPKLQEILDLYQGGEVDKVIKIIESLPKPEGDQK